MFFVIFLICFVVCCFFICLCFGIRAWIGIFGCFGIGYGLFLFISMYQHFSHSVEFCNEYNRFTNNNDMFGFDNDYPYLYVWPYCEYKVYPISDEMPCQCRNLQITYNVTQEWRSMFGTSTSGNGTDRSTIITSALEHYYMIETLRIESDNPITIDKLTNEMMTANMMRVVHCDNIIFTRIDRKLGKNWQYLEYLSVKGSFSLDFEFSQYLHLVKSIKWFEIDYIVKFDYENTTATSGSSDNSGSNGKNGNKLSFLCYWENIIAFDILTLEANVTIPNCVFEDEHVPNLQWANFDISNNFDIRLLGYVIIIRYIIYNFCYLVLISTYIKYYK